MAAQIWAYVSIGCGPGYAVLRKKGGGSYLEAMVSFGKQIPMILVRGPLVWDLKVLWGEDHCPRGAEAGPLTGRLYLRREFAHFLHQGADVASF